MIVHIIIFFTVDLHTVPVVLHFCWAVPLFAGIDDLFACYFFMIFSVEKSSSWESCFETESKESIIEIPDLLELEISEGGWRKLKIDMILQIVWLFDLGFSLSERIVSAG